MSNGTDNLLENPRMPQVGQAVLGRYQIQRVLGKGGFGAVYLAIDSQAGGTVALKVLSPDKSDVPDFVDRFRQEVKVTRNLRHHNTIKIWDVGQTESGCLFMAMEYLEGEDLGDLTQREGGLPPDRVVRITKQILLSLSEAHRLGVIHRDLKPANVMIQQQVGEPDYTKVLDFGIAKALVGSDLAMVETRAGEFLGTAAYAAPELLRNKGITPATDLYAVGLMMLEMLTGQQAVSGDTMPDIIVKQMSPDPVGLPQWVIKTPVGRVIFKAIQKDQASRYQSADEMLEALTAIASTSQIRGPITQAQRTGELPKLGDLVNHRYLLQTKLGEGGFGVVFLALDHKAGGKLAMKFIDPTKTNSPDAADRFRQESALVRELHHHNTIKIWDVGETESGALFMAMEYVEGDPLDKLIRQTGGLPVERVIRISKQILRSLSEAHQLGVIHRDLKPGNIVVQQLKSESDYVKVLDFGIAKALEPKLSMVETAFGQVMCTPSYAAPELIRSKGIRPATDIYALGLLMLEMLTGQQAVKGSGLAELVAQQMSPDPIPIPPPWDHHPIAGILQKAVAKEITDRYQGADEMLADLTNLGQSLAAGVVPSVPTAMIASHHGAAMAEAGPSTWPTAAHRQLEEERSSGRPLLIVALLLIVAAAAAGAYFLAFRDTGTDSSGGTVAGGPSGVGNGQDTTGSGVEPTTHTTAQSGHDTEESDAGTREEVARQTPEGTGTEGQPTAAVEVTPLAEGSWVTDQLAAVEGQVELGGPQDRYTIANPEVRVVLIDLVAEGFDTYLQVFDPRGTPIARDDNGGGGTNSRFFGELQPGDYTVEVSSAAGLPAQPDYRISVRALQRLEEGRSIDGVLGDFEVSGHRDGLVAHSYFVVDETKPLQLRASSDAFDTWLQVLNRRGELVIEDDDSGDGTNSSIVTQLDPGLYLIELSSADGEGTGGFQLALAEVEEVAQRDPEQEARERERREREAERERLAALEAQREREQEAREREQREEREREQREEREAREREQREAREREEAQRRDEEARRLEEEARLREEEARRLEEQRSNLPRRLSSDQVNAVLRASHSSAGRCRGSDVPGGARVEIPVEISLEGNGHVSSARADRTGPTASCIEGVVEGLEFPEFSGSAMRFTYTYVLR